MSEFQRNLARIDAGLERLRASRERFDALMRELDGDAWDEGTDPEWEAFLSEHPELGDIDA
jgi:hypothetical protein